MMLLHFLLVSTAVASPLLGTEQCARGPPYWCQNAKTASLCGAVSHCQQNVWNQPHVEGSEVCDDCVKFITDTQTAAKKNTTFIDALIAQIESQCDLLGPGIAVICRQYVSQYAPLIFQQLMSMQPIDICCHAGFCDSTTKSVPMLNLVPAKSMAATKTFPATKLVKPSYIKPAKKMVRARDSLQCAICEYVMKEVESLIQHLTTKDEVVHAMEIVCSILPSTLSAQCKDLIDTYGKAIIELLIQEADPKTVCSLLGLCRDASRTFVPVMKKAEIVADSFYEVCKMSVRYVDGILEQNATEAQIEEAVKKVCNFLPDEYKMQCDQLIEQYEPLIVQLMLQALDPEFVCMAVNHCRRHVWS